MAMNTCKSYLADGMSEARLSQELGAQNYAKLLKIILQPICMSKARNTRWYCITSTRPSLNLLSKIILKGPHRESNDWSK